MERSTHIVVDLGFGDAGKGTMVDAIARRCSSPPLVVRHNGGAQAGHNVHTKDGRHHTFSQFGAATFVPKTKTLLSKHMVLHPLGLTNEFDHLQQIGERDALDRLYVDERALVITPFHQAMNRAREVARGAARHGTCGLGVGDTVKDSLDCDDAVRVRDLGDRHALRVVFERVRDRKIEQAKAEGLDLAMKDLHPLRDPEFPMLAANVYAGVKSILRVITAEAADAMVREHEHVIFEGAQGVLIDEWYGFHPHTTWSTTTTENALAMIKESGRDSKVTRLGVVRSYATRHGEGPFPSEDAYLTEEFKDTHNVDTGWQGKFRVGYFDVPLTKYALSVCPVDGLVMTHCDRAEDGYVAAYDRHIDLHAVRGDLDHQEDLCNQLMAAKPVISYTSTLWSFTREIADKLGVPLVAESFGPCAEDKKWR